MSITLWSSVMITSAWAHVRIVAGSRSTRSHAARSFAMFAPASSGAPHVFHSSAWVAVMRSMRGLDVPTRIGSGDWTGFGSIGASVIV